MILGIDPGFAITGFAVLKNKTSLLLQECGIIKTSAKDDFPKRLFDIENNLQEMITHYSFSSAAVESLFFYDNKKTAIHVAHARGIILKILYQLKIPTYEYTPPQVKKALTGNGHATKLEVQGMVERILNLKDFSISQNDACDAIAIAICHSHSMKR